MLTRSQFHNYQEQMVGHLVARDQAGLFCSMGSGKTASTLTALLELQNACEVNQTLIIAPKRVSTDTWPDEIKEWDHTCEMQFTVLTGLPAKQRAAAARNGSPIHIINVENIQWLVALHGADWPYDHVIIDESPKFKGYRRRNNPTARELERAEKEDRKPLRNLTRFGALASVRKYIYTVWILTATPAPNGYLDLWSQLFLLDKGKRLGTARNSYRDRFFHATDYQGYRYELRRGADKLIQDRISDIILTVDVKDHLDVLLPRNNPIKVHLPDSVMAQYRELERHMLLELGDEEIAVETQAALVNKLLQFANGAMYREDKTWVEVHRAKLEALDEAIEGMNGEPVIVAIDFKFDRERILKRYKGAVLLDDTEGLQKKWNAGEIPILVTHPASAGHGLNLQHGGCTIIWYGLTWNLEYFLQLNERVGPTRQKQSGYDRVVTYHYLIAAGTREENVLAALTAKDATQQGLLDALKSPLHLPG